MAAVKAYRYSAEIAQMCYVFGQPCEPDEEVVQTIEDIVRAQLAEIVLQARALATRRNSRHLSTEDLLFLVRHDRAKVTRLRIYLGWKDVRKKAKENEGAEEGPDIDIDELPTDKPTKSRSVKARIPWDVTSIFAEHLHEDSDAEDQDEIEAYEDGKQRLREADGLTRDMTKEQYAHYADCRQASFTYRKAKRFREFVNITPHIDVATADEVMDVLGFLSYEMVRTLCEAASESKRSSALSLTNRGVRAAKEERLLEARKGKEVKRGIEDVDDTTADVGSTVSTPVASTSAAAPKALKKPKLSRAASSMARPAARSPPPRLVEPTSLFSTAREGHLASGLNTPSVHLPGVVSASSGVVKTEGVEESSALAAQGTLQLEELMRGFTGMQQSAAVRHGGMRNWRSGGRRPKPELI